MLQTLVRRSAGAARSTFNIHTNPFKAKKPWPPDFDKTSQMHQFRLEKRYRRRTKLKFARPKWMKITKLAQWGSIICTRRLLYLYSSSHLPMFLVVIVYGTLFMEVGEQGTPFEGVSIRSRVGANEALLTTTDSRMVYSDD